MRDGNGSSARGGHIKGDFAVDKGWESGSSRQCRRTSRPRNSNKRLTGREMVDETNTQAARRTNCYCRATSSAIVAMVLSSAIAGYQATLVGHPPGGTPKADYEGSRVDKVSQRRTSQASSWVARLAKRGKFE